MKSPNKNRQPTRVLPDQTPRDLSNVEIVTLAVYLLGGDARYVDTEDVAVKANEIMPGRFAWVKYPEQINIHTIKTHLWDAKSERKGSLLLGSEIEGWMLTENGLELTRNRIHGLVGVKVEKRKLSANDQKWIRNERVRLLKSDAFAKARQNRLNDVTVQEATSLFRIDEYVTGAARERKISRIINVFRNDPQIGPVVIELAKRVKVDKNNEP